MVGIGYGKAREVPLAIQKAVENARKSLIRVPKYGQTIPHRIIGRFGAGHVVLRPASPGTGVIAGGGVRAVLELGGVRDVLTKSIGTQNPINLVKATMEGLISLRRPEDVAKLRGLIVNEVLGLAEGERQPQSDAATPKAPAADGPDASAEATAAPTEPKRPTPAASRRAEAPSRDARRGDAEAAERSRAGGERLMADVALKQVRSANGASPEPARHAALAEARPDRPRVQAHATSPQLQGMLRVVGHLVEVEDEADVSSAKPRRARSGCTPAPEAGLAPAAQAARPRRGLGPRQDLGPRPQGRRRALGQQAQARLRGRAEPDPHADAQAARPAQEDVDAVRAVPHPHPAGQRRRPRGPLRGRRRGHARDAARDGPRQAPPPGQGARPRRDLEEAHRPRPRLQRHREGEDRGGRRHLRGSSSASEEPADSAPDDRSTPSRSRRSARSSLFTAAMLAALPARRLHPGARASTSTRSRRSRTTSPAPTSSASSTSSPAAASRGCPCSRWGSCPTSRPRSSCSC